MKTKLKEHDIKRDRMDKRHIRFTTINSDQTRKRPHLIAAAK